MKIKKKNVARMASLSALGAGALGLAAGTAEAGTVEYKTFDIAYQVTSSVNSSNPLQLGSKLIPVNFGVSAHSSRSSLRSGSSWLAYFKGSGLKFQTASNALALFGAGAKWSTAAGGAVSATAKIGWMNWFRQYRITTSGSSFKTFQSQGSSAGGHVNQTFANQYALFQFTQGGESYYGWLKLSGQSGQSYDWEAWGYDTAGNQIAAGDIGESGGSDVPEPSTLFSTGLAALALGASGVRRWRASRQPAA